jgi:hypothetical protein
MTTYYFNPDMNLDQIKIGDNILNVPYKSFDQLIKWFKTKYPKFDYLYEGKNLIIFSL